MQRASAAGVRVSEPPTRMSACAASARRCVCAVRAVLSASRSRLTSIATAFSDLPRTSRSSSASPDENPDGSRAERLPPAALRVLANGVLRGDCGRGDCGRGDCGRAGPILA